MIFRDLLSGDYISVITETGLTTDISYTYRVDIKDRTLLYDESTGGYAYPKIGILKYFLVDKDTNWTYCSDTSYFNKQLERGLYSTIYFTEIKNETIT